MKDVFWFVSLQCLIVFCESNKFTNLAKKRVVTLPQITTGSTRRLPRWEECTQETMGFMDWAVGRLYVEEVFNNEFQVQVNFSHCLLKVLLKRAVERI